MHMVGSRCSVFLHLSSTRTWLYLPRHSKLTLVVVRRLLSFDGAVWLYCLFFGFASYLAAIAIRMTWEEWQFKYKGSMRCSFLPVTGC
jgi:hypothetical protein